MSQPSLREYGVKSYLDVLDDSLEYIKDRAAGKIKSFKTPWTGLNNAGIGGLEWGSIFTVAARPGAGKTMITSQILREAYQQNPGQKFNILEFQFEMGSKQYGSRAFAAEMAKDYNEILSTRFPLDEFIIKRMEQYKEEVRKVNELGMQRMFMGRPVGHETMYKLIHQAYNELGGSKLVVTIDHSWLVKKADGEKEKINTLYNTVEMLMKIKNELPVIIIMLSQLNRTIDEASRKMPGTIANYPTSSDIFGGDALMQGSDMLVVLNRPYKADIKVYGPKKYHAGPDNIFMHLLKVRNGSNDDSMLFFEAQFNRQRMAEIAPPAITNSPTSANGYQLRNTGILNRTEDTGPEM